jgi:Asp-tRNA(Asn)/Glu-tRNA(Gln) amidotransferase A subunit family amidase
MDATAAALRRYRETEPEIRAWVQVAPQPPLARGPLSGVPFGVKDIIETRGLATEYGSPLYAGRLGTEDAAIVTALRERGAVMFGKTQTTAFAYFDPSPTRNPRRPSHTPGGSSSGSAAAVAAGVVPFALGTQTQGSIVRPSSFCGVVGFKPTFGRVPTAGVLPFAPSLDTVGWLAADVAMARRVWQALGFDETAAGRNRFAVPRGLPEVEPAMRRRFDRAAAALNASAFDLPVPYDQLLAALRIVNDFEGARSHQQRWWEHRERIGRKLAELVERGLSIPPERYERARELLSTTRVEGAWDVLLTPAGLGPAPAGLASTGDPIMNAVWTGLGMPAVCVPMPVAEGELPLGLQMIARRGADATLLEAAAAAEKLLGAERPQ